MAKKEDIHHLKTRVGEFWVYHTSQGDNKKTILGLDDDELGNFDTPEQAAEAVANQETGCSKWDCQSKSSPAIKVPEKIEEWNVGKPNNWN